MPRLRYGTAIVALLLILAGCGSKAPSPQVTAWSHHPVLSAMGTQVDIRFGPVAIDPTAQPQLLMTLSGFDSEATASSGWSSPPPVPSLAPKGYFLVAAHLQVFNASAVTFSGDLLANSEVVDFYGRHFRAIAGVVTDAGPSLPGGDISIHPRSSLDGWIVFQVPHDDPLHTVLIAPGGADSEQGAWNIWGPWPTPDLTNS